MTAEIYIGTILIEKLRWAGNRPSLLVSDWLQRFKNDGFDGVDLMERHGVPCAAEEIAKLQASPLPLRIFNSYVKFTEEDAGKRLELAGLIAQLGIKRVKFGLGHDRARQEECLRNVQEWLRMLPADCVLLHESHDGMMGGTPGEAATLFNGVLSDPRFHVIIHPLAGPDYIRKWFDAVGERITHTHLNLRNELNEGIMLRRAPEKVMAALDALKAEGFGGTHTLEFTEGIRTVNEDAESLYACALEDLAFLREGFGK